MIPNMEYADRRELQRTYLDGLKRYKSKGVSILIDGEECPESEWNRIFEIGEDGSFYMGDYVGADVGCLREIRFDRVYLSSPPSSMRESDRERAARLRAESSRPDTRYSRRRR